MRNESWNQLLFSTLHDTVLLWGRGIRTPNCTWRCRKKQERRRKKKSGCTTSSASHLMLFSWVSLTLVALPSSRVQAGPTLAGGAAALGVWRVLLIDGVEQQARGWPRQVGMPRLSSMLLRGLAEPFLLVARRPHMAAVTEV